jgi:hypothetical protein
MLMGVDDRSGAGQDHLVYDSVHHGFFSHGQSRESSKYG